MVHKSAGLPAQRLDPRGGEAGGGHKGTREKNAAPVGAAEAGGFGRIGPPSGQVAGGPSGKSARHAWEAPAGGPGNGTGAGAGSRRVATAAAG